MKVRALSRVRLCATPWTAAHQAPPWDFPGKSTGAGAIAFSESCSYMFVQLTRLCENAIPLHRSMVPPQWAIRLSGTWASVSGLSVVRLLLAYNLTITTVS